jgi:hypothetical protein
MVEHGFRKAGVVGPNPTIGLLFSFIEESNIMEADDSFFQVGIAFVESPRNFKNFSKITDLFVAE